MKKCFKITSRGIEKAFSKENPSSGKEDIQGFREKFTNLKSFKIIHVRSA